MKRHYNTRSPIQTSSSSRTEAIMSKTHPELPGPTKDFEEYLLNDESMPQSPIFPKLVSIAYGIQVCKNTVVFKTDEACDQEPGETDQERAEFIVKTIHSSPPCNPVRTPERLAHIEKLRKTDPFINSIKGEANLLAYSIAADLPDGMHTKHCDSCNESYVDKKAFRAWLRKKFPQEGDDQVGEEEEKPDDRNSRPRKMVHTCKYHCNSAKKKQ